MMRDSGSPWVRPARRTLRGLGVLAFSAIGLCSAAVAQEPAHGPPPVSPLAPIPPAPPPKDAGAFPRMDRAIECATASVASPATSIPTIEALPLPYMSPGSLPHPYVSPGESRTPTRPSGSSAPDLLGASFSAALPPAPLSKDGASADEWLAGLRAAAERDEKRLRALDVEIRQHPDRAEAFYKRGCLRAQLARSGRKDATDGAMADLTRAVELKPDHVEARHWRGFIAGQRQEWDAAIADLSWVIEHHPEIVVALGERAQIWMRRGDYDRAIADLDRAEGRIPGPTEKIWARRAWCYAARGEHDRAIAEYTRAIAASATGSESWVYRGRAQSYRAKDDIDRALDDLDSALAIDPNDTAVHFLRADILLEDGDYWDAAREADRLTELLPNHPGPRFLRSMVSWMAAIAYDYDLSDAAWAAALAGRIFPCAAAPQLARELANAAIGECRKAARKALDNCLAIEPRLSCLYALRASYHASEGRFLPTCRDLVLFVARFHRRNYHFWARIDWQDHRFSVGFKEQIARPEAAAGVASEAADVGGQCMERGLQQLLASAFGPDR